MFTKVRLRFDIKRDILLLLYRGGPKEIAFRQDEKWGIQMNKNVFGSRSMKHRLHKLFH